MGTVLAASLMSLLWISNAGAAPLGIDSVVALVRASGVRSIEELLPLLPEELRRGHSLVPGSRSIQVSSREHPRVILFGNTATLILAFNGDPAHRGFDDLEMLEFDEHSGRFKLREIQFSRAGGAPRVSAVNPGKCVGCHGEPARPIWDTLPDFPGVYRSSDDPGYRALMARVRTEPASRYRHLSGELSGPGRLNLLLLRHNYVRVFRELKAKPVYPRVRTALLAAVSRCTLERPIQDYFTPEINERMLAEGLSPAQLEKSTADGVTAYLDAKRARLVALDPATPLAPVRAGQWREESLFIAHARYVLRTAGLDADGWSMTREPETFALGAEQGSLEFLVALLARDILGQRPELRRYLKFENERAHAIPETRAEYCGKLAILNR